MNDEEFERRQILESFPIQCDKCHKELNVYMNDRGVDGSVAVYCFDCYNAEKI